MSLKLTTEQKEKLYKLDQELEKKKEHDQKNRPRLEKSSRETGIPIDIVDMDVIKIGTLLGLIKKKSILEGKEPDTGSLLNVLFGNNETTVDMSKIPPNFKMISFKCSESDKIRYHQQYVQQQCNYLSNIVMSLIKKELANINHYVAVNLESNTINNFKTVCMDTLEVLLDELCQEDDQDDELWKAISVIRNALLGILDICEYKSLLNDHIILLRKTGKSYHQILNHLSINDIRLSLYQGCLTRTKGPLTAEDANRLSREIQLRCYIKPPELKPFNFETIIKHCCIPSLVCVPIDEVLEYGLVGPFRNNSIGYLPIEYKTSLPWSFYNLKSISSDGTRLWILDNTLWILTENMISTMTAYLIKIFKTFFYEYYKNNIFQPNFWLSYNNTHYDAFQNMMRSIAFISNYSMFHKFIIMIMTQKSPLIPTNYDFFNHITFYEIKINYRPYSTVFRENMNLLFDNLNETNLSKLMTQFM